MSIVEQAVDSQVQAPAKVPLLDVARGNEPLREEILAAIADVCDSGQFVLGPAVSKLEEAVAEYCGTPHAVGCASGSDALLLALMAYDIGPGDEVICPSFTFFATASAAWRLGAKPVLVDIDPVSYNLSPAAVAAAITPRTRAIIPVHLFGQCADMAAINEMAAQREIAVIEDAAQAIGAAYEGRPAGSLGDVACFSFYPTKNLGGFGDGGMLTTGSAEIADRLQLLRGHGMRPRYHHSCVGVNSRLDSIQAAVLSVKLGQLPDWTIARQQNAARYTQLFQAAGLTDVVGLPTAGAGQTHVWNQYTVRIAEGRRDDLRQHMQEHGVGSEIYYPIPLHQQDCFHSLEVAPGSLPETERAAAEVLSLPIFPELTESEQQRVVQVIGKFFGRQ